MSSQQNVRSAAHTAADVPGFRVARLAAAQDGVVTRAQLITTGLSHDQVDRWLRAGRLHPVHLGVLAVGHPPTTRRAHLRAALLAAGPDGALFRETAAHHTQMVKQAPPEIQVVTLGPVVRRPGIATYRRPHLDPLRDITVIDGLRCTTVAGTLVDLAPVLSFRELEQAAANAEFRRMLDLRAVAAAFERAKGCTGAQKVRRLLGEGQVQTQTRFERAVHRGILNLAVPEPILQQRFVLPDGTVAYPDFWWPSAALVAEADGPHHLRPIQRAKDRRRDAGFAEMGIAVVRIPMAAWDADPTAALAPLLALLAPC